MTLHLISEEFVLAFRNKSIGHICCTLLYTPTHWKLPKLHYINTVDVRLYKHHAQKGTLETP